MESIKKLTVNGVPCHLWRHTDDDGRNRYVVTLDSSTGEPEEPVRCRLPSRAVAIGIKCEELRRSHKEQT